MFCCKLIREVEVGVKTRVTLKLLMFVAIALVVAHPSFANVSGKSARVALVVGNSNYRSQEIEKLRNPGNDAVAITGALRRLKFEVVQGRDLTYRQFSALVEQFVKLAQSAEVALIFYSGHGFQFQSKNHLVPVDFETKQLRDPSRQPRTINLSDLVSRLEITTPTRLLFLDACRDDPSTQNKSVRQFGASLSRSIKSINRDSRNRGLIPVVQEGYSEISGSTGTFISYATAPGKTAMDGTGDNSPFASALLKHIETPGQRLEDLVRLVRADVASTAREYGQDQTPWHTSSLSEIFYFVPELVGRDLFAALQTSLRGMSCYSGNVDGQWGAGSRRAMRRFNSETSSTYSVDRPDHSVVAALQKQFGNGFRCTAKSLNVFAGTRSQGTSSSRRNRPASARNSGSNNRRSRPATVPPSVGAGVGVGSF